MLGIGNTKPVSNGVSMAGMSDGVNAETWESAGEDNPPSPGTIEEEASVK